MAYAESVAEHLRLTILRLLSNNGGGYSANESVLTDAANNFGFNASRDRIRTALAWLKEQGLVTVSEVEGMHVAELTARGLDVAEGRATVPGIKRPSPKG